MSGSEMNSRLIPDYDSICDDINNVLDSVRTINTDRYFNQAMGDLAIQKFKDYDVAIRKRLRDAFSLVVVGDFKRGKSTLINALLGANIVTTAVTTETVTINKISYAETSKVEAVLKNGMRAALTWDELKRDSIETVMKELPTEIDYIDIRADNEILRDISIVDTPGIGDLMKAFDKQVTEYLVNADALIYVISARSPLSLSEQAFLSSVIMPQSFYRLFLAVNMADTLETEENIVKIRDLTIQRAHAVSEKIFVYTLSALDEVCRKQNLERPEPQLEKYLENSFLAFETALRDDIILQKNIIKSMRGAALTHLMLDDMAARVGMVKNSLKVNVEELTKTEKVFQGQNAELLSSIERHKTSLSESIDLMTAEAQNWFRNFMERLKSEIATIGASNEMSDLERYFQFYLLDLLKSALTTCMQQHQNEIQNMLSEKASTISEEISHAVFGSVNTRIAESIRNVSWTGSDTTAQWLSMLGQFSPVLSQLGRMVPALFLLGKVGKVLSKAGEVGPVVAGFTRQKTVAKKQTDFIAPVLDGFDSIVGDAVKNLDEIYAKLKKNALNALDEIYRQQVAASEEAIHNARQIALDENTRVEDVVEYLDGVLKLVESNKELLAKYTYANVA